MIPLLLHHLRHHLFCKCHRVGVRHLRLAELPHGNLGDQQNAVAVGEVQDHGVLRVVYGPRQRDLQFFHFAVVVQHGAACFGEALPRRVLVTRHPAQAYALAVQI